MRRSTVKLGIFAAYSFLGLANADWPGRWGNGDDDGDWDGDGNPYWGGDNDDDDDEDGNDSSNFGASNGFGLGSLQDFEQANRVLIAHAVIASLVWV
jgi:hypothetical protein